MIATLLSRKPQPEIPPNTHRWRVDLLAALRGEVPGGCTNPHRSKPCYQIQCPRYGGRCYASAVLRAWGRWE